VQDNKINTEVVYIMVYVFLADGFEEIEALTVVDLLRRCDIETVTVGIGREAIRGAHGILVQSDIADKDFAPAENTDMIVLPGGMPGTKNLEASAVVQSAIDFCVENEKYIAAICAAPSILGHRGLLDGHEALCYAGFEKQLEGAQIAEGKVCLSGKYITSRGPGTAIDFSLKIVEVLKSRQISTALAASLMYT